MRYPHGALLALGVFFLAWWFRVYLTDANLPSVDLPSQVVLIEQLRTHLLSGRIGFYDRLAFTGYPAFQFYGFFPSLCAALLSFVLDFAGGDSTVGAVHLLLLSGAALLPLSLYYAVYPLAEEIVGKTGPFRCELAALVVALTFWFLNHDQQWFGIGAAAPMHIGLFSQLFGWHLLLLHLGLLVRMREGRDEGDTVKLAVVYGLLPLTHTLTFVYATYLSLGILLLGATGRGRLITAHLLGLGLSAFWLMPCAAFLGSYAAYDVSRPTGDFLEIVFRYPWYGLIRSVRESGITVLATLDIVHLLIPILLLTVAIHPQLPRQGSVGKILLTVLVGAIVFSSGFIATSLPVSFHYYRFLGYQFLTLVAVLTAIPLILLRSVALGFGARVILLVGSLWTVLSTAALPHTELSLVADRKGIDYLTDEERIVAFFQEDKDTAPRRVYVEYLTDYERYPFLSAHYLSSRLARVTNVEPIVSSHLQESLAYRMIAGSAHMLKAKTYHVPLLFPEHATLAPQDLLSQLREFGITHVVCGTRKFCGTLRSLVGAPVHRSGPYRLFALGQPAPPLSVRTKTALGFVSGGPELPFHLLQLYFYSRAELYRNFELLQLDSLGTVPKEISLVLTNSRDHARLDHTQLLPIGFTRPAYHLRHHAPHYPHNVELDHYREIADYFDRSGFIENLLALTAGERVGSRLPAVAAPELVWSSDGQSFELKNLEPGRLYRLNYSYFPYWRVKEGALFRGSLERMYVLPAATIMRGTFTRWHHASSWIGVCLTLMSAVTLLRVRRRAIARSSEPPAR